MFTRYWRTYPWGLQVFLFLSTWFTFFWFGFYLVLTLVPKLSGFSLKELLELSAASTPKAIRWGVIAQAVSHVFAFALPGLLVASFTHPNLREYLGLRKPGKSVHWLLVTGIMLGLIPVLLWGEGWFIQHVHLGKWADDVQASGNRIVGAFLQLTSVGDLILLLFVLALLPAVGEEIIFRGILLRIMHRRGNKTLLHSGMPPATRNPKWAIAGPIIGTTILFTAFHGSNPYGIPFIFIGGFVLGLVYFLTGSLLCSIWAHFLYNGSQVIEVFFSPHDKASLAAAEAQNLPIYYPIVGLLLFSACFYLLVKNQTPLPPDWSDNFRGEPRERYPIA